MKNINISIEERLKQISIEQPEYLELWDTWELNKYTLEPIVLWQQL